MPIWDGSPKREMSSGGYAASLLSPVVVPDVSYLRNPEHLEFLLAGLRLAAGEETCI
jgi:hypothetical protein